MAEKPVVLIVGLGLLGGSLGLSLADRGVLRLGWSRRAETCQQALDAGAIDESASSLEELLPRADLIVLAMPIPQIISFLETFPAERCKPGCIVTDLGSTKSSILAAAQRNPAMRFIGSHPMAGTEKSGIANAFAGLYDGADVFVVPPEKGDPEGVRILREFWEMLGTHVTEICAKEHDLLVANTSHVLHVVASALALSILDAPDQQGRDLRFAGCATGFRDTSRIASSNPVMWREIIGSNREAVLRAIDGFEACFQEFRKLIDAGNWEEFETRFASGKVLRDSWLEYKKNASSRRGNAPQK